MTEPTMQYDAFDLGIWQVTQTQSDRVFDFRCFGCKLTVFDPAWKWNTDKGVVVTCGGLFDGQPEPPEPIAKLCDVHAAIAFREWCER